MSRSRFARIKVLNKDGERVAQLHDTEAGRDLFIVRRSGAYLHWDRNGSPVDNEALRRAASVALGHGVKDRAVTGKATHRAPTFVPPKRPERPCERCEVPFVPKGPGSKICPTCKSEAGNREWFQAKAERTARAIRALVAADEMGEVAEDVRGLAIDDLSTLRYTKPQITKARAFALDGYSVEQVLGVLAGEQVAA